MSKLSLSLVLLVALPLVADNPETLSERSQSRARSVLDAAVTAIGGAEALQNIKAVRLELQGKTWARLQMTTPDPPFENGTFHETLLFDLENNRLHLEQRNAGAGFEGHNTTILTPTEGTNYDHRAKLATPIPVVQLTGQQFIQYHRRLPHLLLRQALANPNSLRFLGDDPFDGRNHKVITFVMPDTQQVALYVDSDTNLVSKYELLLTDPLVGEDVSEIMFADYKTAGRLKVPQSWKWRIAGDQQASYSVKAEFNPPLPDNAFALAAASSYHKVTPNPQNLPAKVEKLADGVFVIENVAGPNQNTLAVEFKDYILAVEAPGTSAGADAVIRRIKETIPNKPIRYIAMTHHHGDHIGGLRSFIAEGATVVTTKSNQKTVETMAAAPQKDRLASAPRKAEFAFIENGKRVFTDGTRTVELLDIGPNPHAREMVIAWLPAERIVFQGDLFALPNNDAPLGPAQAGTVSFAKALTERGLNVERIASVHGRTATIEQLREALGGVAPAGP